MYKIQNFVQIIISRQKTPPPQDEPLRVPAAPALALCGSVQDPPAAGAGLLRPVRPEVALGADEERRVAGRRHGGRPGMICLLWN